jgi:hypothetical protein
MSAETATPVVHISITERAGRFHVAWRCSDTSVFAAMVQDLRATFGHRHRDLLWSAEQKAWSLPATGTNRRLLEEWAASWVPDDTDNITWERDTTRAAGQGSSHQTGRTRTQRESATRTTPTDGLAGDLAVLHLLPTAPPELWHGAYRILSQLTHPDVAVKAPEEQDQATERQTALNAAYGRLRQRLAAATR